MFLHNFTTDVVTNNYADLSIIESVLPILQEADIKDTNISVLSIGWYWSSTNIWDCMIDHTLVTITSYFILIQENISSYSGTYSNNVTFFYKMTYQLIWEVSSFWVKFTYTNIGQTL